MLFNAREHLFLDSASISCHHPSLFAGIPSLLLLMGISRIFRATSLTQGWSHFPISSTSAFLWTQEGSFSLWEQPATGIISQGKWWIPQRWILLRCSCTGCWAILSRPRFAKKGRTRWSSRSFPTWDSMILWLGIAFPSQEQHSSCRIGLEHHGIEVALLSLHPKNEGEASPCRFSAFP